MFKIIKVNGNARFVPHNDETPDWSFPLGLEGNARIASALGFKTEFADGIVKTWDAEVIPDHTNWKPASDYCGNDMPCLDQMESIEGVQWVAHLSEDGSTVICVDCSESLIELSGFEKTSEAFAAALCFILEKVSH